MEVITFTHSDMTAIKIGPFHVDKAHSVFGSDIISSRQTVMQNELVGHFVIVLG